jgi:hypothetical protein
MKRIGAFLPWLILLLTVIKILAVVQNDPLIAYANNWDFARESACYGVWEHYPNGKDKTTFNFEGPVNPLIYDGDKRPEWCAHVADNAFIRLVLAFHTKGNTVDLRSVGLAKAVFLIGMGTWMLLILGSWRSRMIAIVSFAIAFGDIQYLAFLNTLYAEFSMLAGGFFSVVGLYVLLFDRRVSRASVAFCVVSLFFFGFAKAQYMPLAVGVGFVMAGVLLVKRKNIIEAGMIAVLAIVLPLTFSVSNRMAGGVMSAISVANIVDTVMVGVLPNTEDPVASMRKLGLPDHCEKGLGVSWYEPGVANNLPCPEVANMSRLKLLGLFLWDSSAFFRPMSLAVDRVRPLQLGYLPNAENLEVRSSLIYRFVKATSLSTYLDSLPTSVFAVLVLGCWVLGGLAAIRSIRSEAAFFATTGAVFMFYAVLSSVFGDGFMEISKHATAISLGMFFQITAVVSLLSSMKGRRGSSR